MAPWAVVVVTMYHVNVSNFPLEPYLPPSRNGLCRRRRNSHCVITTSGPITTTHIWTKRPPTCSSHPTRLQDCSPSPRTFSSHPFNKRVYEVISIAICRYLLCPGIRLEGPHPRTFRTLDGAAAPPHQKLIKSRNGLYGVSLCYDVSSTNKPNTTWAEEGQTGIRGAKWMTTLAI